MKSSSISSSKAQFNRFFQEDLYGQFDSPDNIILSRGSWRDDVVKLPELFRFCINYTLDQQWVGYSDSLGHENVFDALHDLANVTEKEGYTPENYALTMGNVATMSIVFRQLRSQFPDSKVLTFQPYYPSVVKAVHEAFPEMVGISALAPEEADVIQQIKDACRNDDQVKILLLSNFIGVEGRIFSKEFWAEVIEIAEDIEGMLVIDEGLWYEGIEYPETINNERTIRVVSTSKKYGNPGMKMGFMLGPQEFISRYYESASTHYGGPPSLLFLSAEFLYQFEHALITDSVAGLERLTDRYKLRQNLVEGLYDNFKEIIAFNHGTYATNRALFAQWLEENSDLIRSSHLFQGINFFVEPNTDMKCYELFLQMIQQMNVSVFPGSCLGDIEDTLCRITILECQADTAEGLARVSRFLKECQ